MQIHEFSTGKEAFEFIRRELYKPACSCGAYIQSWKLEDDSEIVIRRNDLIGGVGVVVTVYESHEDRMQLERSYGA